jgi:hypothetical protein
MEYINQGGKYRVEKKTLKSQSEHETNLSKHNHSEDNSNTRLSFSEVETSLKSDNSLKVLQPDKRYSKYYIQNLHACQQYFRVCTVIK